MVCRRSRFIQIAIVWHRMFGMRTKLLAYVLIHQTIPILTSKSCLTLLIKPGQKWCILDTDFSLRTLNLPLPV